ncbi:MFS transporter [Gordonia phthalatica]|uniref:MFS transporter n=1 Tax=Gordonia phthalatica TaxID=1136941 RepID=A0A0N9MT83_9ACTN|nr:MFS transporter [Gordonia phthalatica]ALG85756.1 MFS transporter [Gordonia phthalatica]
MTSIEAVQRRTLRVVVASQVLGGAGLAAGVAVGALLAKDMLGSDGFAGLPMALFTLGSAFAAYLIGRFTQQRGRRIGLGLGFAGGGIGAIGVVVAAVIGNVPLLFASFVVYGAGTASNLQARYAGADLASPEQRGRAISVALVSTTLGAVAGPNLIDPLGKLAVHIGIPALAGPFLLAAVAYLGAGAVLIALLRPDPYLLAQELAPHRDAVGTESTGSPWRSRTVIAGAAAMVLTQIMMVAVMTMTPVHMLAHDHSLAQVGVVIGVHIGAMYLPSLVTGTLVDRIGRTAMALGGGVTLLAAGILAALAPPESLALLILALALLGLGWNFGLIAGTALIVDGTAVADRARVQGAVDVLIALAGAGAGAASGVVASAAGFGTLAVVGGLVAMLIVPVLMWSRGGFTQAS